MSCRGSDAETSSRRGDGGSLVGESRGRGLSDTERNKCLVFTLNGVRKTLRTSSRGM